MKEIKEIIKETIQKSKETAILDNYDKSYIRINEKEYRIGQVSFNKVGNVIKEILREIYGDYETIPYTFNSEAHENEKFRTEVLALGFEGMLEFKVRRK